MIEIYVSEFYNQPDYYPFMSAMIFTALEQAFLNGHETARVPVGDYDTMLADYSHSKTLHHDCDKTNHNDVIHPTAFF